MLPADCKLPIANCQLYSHSVLMLKKNLSTLVFVFIRIAGLPFYYCSLLCRTSYQIIIPANTYAPWLKDRKFLRLFRKVKRNSLVNKYQCWELWKAMEQVGKVQGDILEVGVWRGSTSIIMGAKLKALGSSKQIYACDTFEGVAKAAGPNDNYYKGGEHSNTSLNMVEGLIKEQGLGNIVLLKGTFPDETGANIDRERFSFCHIDVDAYQSGRDVLEWLWDRLNPGGIVIFNDYGFPLTKGITHLVNEQYQKNDRLVMHNLNGNGIIIKIK